MYKNHSHEFISNAFSCSFLSKLNNLGEQLKISEFTKQKFFFWEIRELIVEFIFFMF
jgi:hypothetical protein